MNGGWIVGERSDQTSSVTSAAAGHSGRSGPCSASAVNVLLATETADESVSVVKAAPTRTVAKPKGRCQVLLMDDSRLKLGS